MHEDENKQLHLLFPGDPDLVYTLSRVYLSQSHGTGSIILPSECGVIISTTDRAGA